ncbi:MAG: TlpA family protein disulfide reductase [Gammaproteobacteria bacterium]|nr:TlpA family protein disulfide reductase [Gammaproteobacteria bacterium]
MNRWFIGILWILLLIFSWQARAVEYQLPDLNDQMQSLDQYKGKWVIVNYWATWCGTCIKELPDLISLHEAHKDGDIVVVGVNFESTSLGRLKLFVTEHAIPYAILRTEPVPVTPLGPVPALPATYIINPLGKVVAGEVGIVTQKNLEEYIKGKRDAGDYAEIIIHQGSDIQG